MRLILLLLPVISRGRNRNEIGGNEDDDVKQTKESKEVDKNRDIEGSFENRKQVRIGDIDIDVNENYNTQKKIKKISFTQGGRNGRTYLETNTEVVA